MYFDEHGNKENPTIVMLHGAFFVETYGRQYSLCDRFHMVIPHIKGFGKAAAETFTTKSAIIELEELIRGFAPVYLVGFSLGAQLGFKLLTERSELFRRAIIVSPWLVNKEVIPEEIMDANMKQLRQMKKRSFSHMIALINGMPKLQRTEFIDAMQLVSEKTVRNCVDNGISFDYVRGFEECKVPTLVIAGSKEQEDVVNSVKYMAEINACCNYEIWEKAAHNIPPVFAKRFNKKIVEFFGVTEQQK